MGVHTPVLTIPQLLAWTVYTRISRMRTVWLLGPLVLQMAEPDWPPKERQSWTTILSQVLPQLGSSAPS